MKLSGSNRHGRHLQKNGGGKFTPKSGKKGKKRGSRIVRVFAVFAFVLVALMSVVYAYYKLAVKPPPVKDQPRKDMNTKSGDEFKEENPPDVSAPAGSSPVKNTSGRIPGMYTFLVLGTDDGNGNTDTIMLVRFDTENYKVNVVNIPRDTLVNVSWPTKKINSLMANVKIDGTIEKIAEITGFEVDYYVIVDLKAFASLVDAIGGVDFDIPSKMDYDDDAQNLHIHFAKGPTHLNGKKALELVRYRSYASADIGRIDMQQKFLMSAAEQILAKRKSINILSLADIFFNDVKTDLKLEGVIWMAQQLLKVDAENIAFEKLPANYNDSVFKNDSYVTIYVDEWLKMVNEKLNPYYEEITADDVSIYTRGSNGKLYVTDGNYAGSSSWGNSSSTSNSSGSSNNSSSGSGGSGNSGSNSSGGSGSSGNSGSGSNSSGGNSSSGDSGSGGSSSDGSSSPDSSPEPSNTPDVSPPTGNTQEPPSDPNEAETPPQIDIPSPPETSPADTSPPPDAIEITAPESEDGISNG